MLDLDGERSLARVFFSADDSFRGERLAQALPRRLREEGFRGCTLFHSTLGFGTNRRIHADLVEVSAPHGLVLEVVDTAERIEALLALLDEMLTEGLVTVERARVLRYRGGGPSA
jgi:uncharacterized protein